MPGESKIKEYAKIGAVVAGIVGVAMSSGSIAVQSSSNASADARINAIEQNLLYINQWRDKADNKMDVTSHDVSSLNVQLAQVLVKMDNVIECLKELKKTKGYK